MHASSGDLGTLYTHCLCPSDLFLKPLPGGGEVPRLAHIDRCVYPRDGADHAAHERNAQSFEHEGDVTSPASLLQDPRLGTRIAFRQKSYSATGGAHWWGEPVPDTGFLVPRTYMSAVFEGDMDQTSAAGKGHVPLEA